MPVGRSLTRIEGSGVLLATSIGVTVALSAFALFATNTVLPSGVITIHCGLLPAGMDFPVVLVATSIGVTLLLAALTTYAVLSSGVIATPCASSPTGIGRPATRLATSIGV